MKNRLLLFICIACFAYAGRTQRITYGEPNKDDGRQTNFEIIGRYGSNVLIYKNLHAHHAISTYDVDMKEVNKINLDYIPDRVSNVDFISYPTYAWVIYQYQKKSIVYCMAAKIDDTGKKIGEPILLDTTNISYNTDNKLYSIINSEDKKHIMIFKINNKNEKKWIFKTLLFDNEFNNQKTSKFVLPLSNRNDLLTDFLLDNKGNLVFGRGDRTSSNQNIIRFYLVQKPALTDSFTMHQIKLENISLDEVKIKADNTNNRYVLLSFYYKARKNIIDGIFYSEWDKSTNKENNNITVPLGDDIRMDAKGENNIKNAFNEYYIQQIMFTKEGGFVVTAENLYTTARGDYNPFNRWDYFSFPYYSTPMDYYYWNLGRTWGYPYNRGSNAITRYNADNIVILSFDKAGKLQWSNVIHKSQFDENSEASISYRAINTGSAIRFMYNDFEKRSPLLVVQNIDPNGQITHNPTLKNLDKGFSFLPRYSKQISQKQVIVPCLYRNFLTFAKIDFNDK